MFEELRNVLEGKALSVKNNNYLAAAQYITPFIERMDNLGATYTCQVKVPDQVPLTEGQPDPVFTRVHIQAILPRDFYYEEECQKVIGMVYGLDIKTPVAKFYIGDLDRDYNLIAFDPNRYIIQKLESDTAIDYSGIQSLLEGTDMNGLMINQLRRGTIERDTLITKLGEWVDGAMDNVFINDSGKIKLATSLPIDAYKALIKDKDSDFYVPETEEICLWHIYRTFVSLLSKDDKDIINRFEKTILVSRVLHV